MHRWSSTWSRCASAVALSRSRRLRPSSSSSTAAAARRRLPLRSALLSPSSSPLSPMSSSTLASVSPPSAVSAASTSASPSRCFTAVRAPFSLARSPLFPLHQRARADHPLYPAKQTVSDDLVDFNAPYGDYNPPSFTVESTEKKSPDPSDPSLISDWSLRPPSSYPFVLSPSDSSPLNPFGRTGLRGRGKLYSWGPNHAADCILTRASRGGREGERELLVIRRQDTGEWALIGGFIDRGETPEQCAQREFGEEALGIAEEGEGKGQGSEAQRALLSKLFPRSSLLCVYRGYVDDARATDGAWIETAAFAVDVPPELSYDEVDRLLVGGSDATETRWIPIREGTAEFDHLYASHKPMVLRAMAIAHPRTAKSHM